MKTYAKFLLPVLVSITAMLVLGSVAQGAEGFSVGTTMAAGNWGCFPGTLGQPQIFFPSVLGGVCSSQEENCFWRFGMDGAIYAWADGSDTGTAAVVTFSVAQECDLGQEGVLQPYLILEGHYTYTLIEGKDDTTVYAEYVGFGLGYGVGARIGLLPRLFLYGEAVGRVGLFMEQYAPDHCFFGFGYRLQVGLRLII